MKVVLFGASGSIGQGVLRECLRDPGVVEVVAVVRSPLSVRDAKLRVVVHPDFLDFTPLAEAFAGADACFWCLGVTSVGMSPADYERVTYEFTAAAVRVLAEVDPSMAFVFVSGAGTDGTEMGKVRWARVKGKAENLVLATFARGFAFRPAVVEPVEGATSRTALYRWGWRLLSPLAWLLRRLAPRLFTTTAQAGRAMLRVTREGWPRRVLENRDIIAAGTGQPPA